MNYLQIVAISVSAALGSLLRWRLGIILNGIFPSIPLGTLAANLLGGFLIGIFMGITKHWGGLPEIARLAMVTGFLGSLTTFSTFSAETITLLSHQEYLFTGLIITAHVAGTVFATLLGIYTIKLITA